MPSSHRHKVNYMQNATASKNGSERQPIFIAIRDSFMKLSE